MGAVRVDAHQRAVFTVREVAKILGVGRNTLYEALRRGELPALRIGRRVLIPAAWLERILSGETELHRMERTG